jgi:hypothetical protein
MNRLSIENRALKIFTGMWMILFLLMGPIYLHLTIPVLILLLGFSVHRPTSSWLAVLAASLWAGTSRVNWYVMPGMIAAVLYFSKFRSMGKISGDTFSKPALWFIVGTLTAFASMQIYIAFIGHPQSRRFFHQPVFAVVVVSLVTERIIRVRHFARRALCLPPDVDRAVSLNSAPAARTGIPCEYFSSSPRCSPSSSAG